MSFHFPRSHLRQFSPLLPISISSPSPSSVTSTSVSNYRHQLYAQGVNYRRDSSGTVVSGGGESSRSGSTVKGVSIQGSGCVSVFHGRFVLKLSGLIFTLHQSNYGHCIFQNFYAGHCEQRWEVRLCRRGMEGRSRSFFLLVLKKPEGGFHFGFISCIVLLLLAITIVLVCGPPSVVVCVDVLADV